MDTRPFLALVAFSALLAGCAAPLPVGEAEAAHAGTTCAAGATVTGFGADGAPDCTPSPLAGFACPAGEVVVGFDADGVPVCDSVYAVAEAGTPPPPPERASTPAKSLSVTSNGAIGAGIFKNYTVASASPGMTWGDLKFMLNGEELVYDADVTSHTDNFCVATAGTTCATTLDPATGLTAGQMISVKDAALSGQTLRILDADANAVILTLTVG